MKLMRTLLLAVALFTGASTAGAHHAYYNVYDPNRSLTITGIVAEFHFVNPHAMLYLDVTDAAGKVTRWTVEFDGVLNMSEGGWTANSIKPRERVTVTGNPPRDGSERRMFFLKVLLADGTEKIRYANQRVNAIEEERRQRALQRDGK